MRLLFFLPQYSNKKKHLILDNLLIEQYTKIVIFKFNSITYKKTLAVCSG